MIRNLRPVLALLLLASVTFASTPERRLSVSLGAGSGAKHSAFNETWIEASLVGTKGYFGAQVYAGNLRTVYAPILQARTTNDKALGLTLGLRAPIRRASLLAGVGLGRLGSFFETHWVFDVDVAVTSHFRIFGSVRNGRIWDPDGNSGFERAVRYFGGVRLELRRPYAKDTSRSPNGTCQHG